MQSSSDQCCGHLMVIVYLMYIKVLYEGRPQDFLTRECTKSRGIYSIGNERDKNWDEVIIKVPPPPHNTLSTPNTLTLTYVLIFFVG